MRYSNSSRRRRSGFSLIELVAVVTIIGICLSMAVAGFTNVIRKARIDRAAQTLSYDLRFAFALVGRNRQPVLVTWDSANVQFVITDRLASKTYFRTRPLGLSSSYMLGVGLASVNVSRQQTQIFPPGLAEDSMHILIKDAKDTRVISVNRAGLTRVLRAAQ